MHATTATPLAGGSGRSALSQPSAYSALFCKSSSVAVKIARPSARPITPDVLEHRRESAATAPDGFARCVPPRGDQAARPRRCYRGDLGTAAGPTPPPDRKSVV